MEKKQTLKDKATINRVSCGHHACAKKKKKKSEVLVTITHIIKTVIASDSQQFCYLFTYSSFKGFWDLFTYTVLPKCTYVALTEAHLLPCIGTEESQTKPRAVLVDSITNDQWCFPNLFFFAALLKSMNSTSVWYSPHGQHLQMSAFILGAVSL